MQHFFSRLRGALLLLALPTAALAQTGVTIGASTAPNASAALDIVSTTKGVLLPRVADATAIASPATGLIVYQTGGTAGYYYNAGTPTTPNWQQIATAAGAAITASNGLTKVGQDVRLGGSALTAATNVALAGNNLTFSGTGNVGIGGSTAPTQTLDVAGTTRTTNAVVTTALTGSGATIGSVVGLGIRADGGLNLGQNTSDNFFVGYLAGRDNVVGASTGITNHFVGIRAGERNTTGAFNFMEGSGAGQLTTTGGSNLYMGWLAGQVGNGDRNLAIGMQAGRANTVSDNHFVGFYAGNSTNTGSRNTFEGNYAGVYNTSGGQNTFMGFQAGIDNLTGSNNFGFGYMAGPASGSGALTNAGAIGHNARVSQDNSIVLGGTGASAVKVGIGTTAPSQTLDVTGGSIKISTSGQGLIFPDATTQTTAAVTSTASNGLTKTGNNIALGGSLTAQTNILQAGSAFTLTGGNVGIGTAVPQATLETSGDFRVSNGTTSTSLGTTGTGGGDLGPTAQTFTMPVAGTVTTVRLRSGNATFNTTFTIRSGAGPSGAVLAGPQAIAFTPNTNTTVALTTPLALATGVYTLVVNAGSGGELLRYFGAENYTGGNIYVGNVSVSPSDLDFTIGYTTGAATSSLYVAPGGNVGIGTTGTPSQKLDVTGGSIKISTSGQGLIFPDGTTQTTAATTTATTTASNGLTKTGNNIALGGTALGAATDVPLAGNNLTFSGTGNVGIGGSTAPTQTLDVAGTTRTTNAIVTTALTGTGADLGAVVGVGIRADGGLNLGQNSGGVYLGYQAGRVSTGGSNVFIGYQSGYNNSTGSRNVFNGTVSGINNTTGNDNLFTGYQSGFRNTTGGNNLFSGTSSGYANTTGTNNLFSGTNSGITNTTGSNNLFSGSASGYSNTIGNNNLFGGSNSGLYNTTGSDNLFSGTSSGYSNTTGGNNLFSGSSSGYSNTTGSNNLFSGYQSGFSNTTANDNQFNGTNSGYSTTTGGNNVFSGYQSGYYNTTGGNNLFSGYQSGFYNTTGSNNTVLGYNSGPASGSGALTNATALGANVTLTQSNTVVLGNAANVGIGTGTPAQKLDVTGGSIKISTSGQGLIFPDNTTQTTAATATSFIQNQTASPQTGGFNVAGAGTVGGLLTASGGATVTGNATVSGTLGVGGSAAPTSTLQSMGSFAVGVVNGLVGSTGPGGTGTVLGNVGYVGLSPATNSSGNYYLLPAANSCPGRVYYLRNNSASLIAYIGTGTGVDGGNIFEGGSTTGAFTTPTSSYFMQATGATKTVTVISDGVNWTLIKGGN